MCAESNWIEETGTYKKPMTVYQVAKGKYRAYSEELLFRVFGNVTDLTSEEAIERYLINCMESARRPANGWTGDHEWVYLNSNQFGDENMLRRAFVVTVKY